MPPNDPHGDLDHAHLAVAKTEEVGDDGPGAEHALCGAPDGELAALVLAGDAEVRLERRVMHARSAHGRGDGHDVVAALRRPGLVDELVHQIAAGMDQRRALGEGLVRREHSRELLELHIEQPYGLFRGLWVLGHDRRDPVAGEARGLGEQRLVHRALPLAREDAVAAVQVARRVAVRVHAHDAGQGLRTPAVDALDAGVRHGAQQQLGVQQAGELEVVPVRQLPARLHRRVRDGVVLADQLQSACFHSTSLEAAGPPRHSRLDAHLTRG